ncbi:unnamed protein product [Miscanthus lutarioriparius]|uniref:Uncharacterized protein n=1 Tax=Miscanthus lutarioriparius TaxID=422564 RepID=A0A811PEG2_9POAL|nr:unnamed protein product [Miscanthus lutarioriparius]
MARTLLQPNSYTGAPATSLLLLLLVVAAAVAAVVVSLCTSAKNARPRKQRRSSSLAPAPQQEQDGGGAGISRNKQLLASLSGIGVKAATVAKMVSWNRRSPPASGWSSGDDDVGPDGDGTAEEEALWKKAIILGDKCRPLEFSGHITHDSDGNPMQPQPSAINKGDDAEAEG